MINYCHPQNPEGRFLELAKADYKKALRLYLDFSEEERARINETRNFWQILNAARRFSTGGCGIVDMLEFRELSDLVLGTFTGELKDRYLNQKLDIQSFREVKTI